jgi:DNA polymerase III subunit delta
VTPEEAIVKIEQGEIAPVYFLYGEERFFQIEILNALRKALISPENEEFNRETFDGASSSPSDWLQAVQTLSFFGGKKLVAVRDFHEASLDKPAVERVLSYVKDPSLDGTLVLLADKIDRKKKIFKSLSSINFAVPCSSPNEGALVQWVVKQAQKRGYTLKTDASRLLVDRIGAKPGLLISELEKLAVSAGESKSIDEPLVSELVGALKQENVFELTDALKTKNASAAIQILRNQLRHGEEPLKILGTISWQYRLIWEVKHYRDNKTPIQTAARLMEAKPFMIEKAASYCGKFSVGDLRKAFKSLFRADRELKTSSGSPELIMEALILKLCSAS